jgi:hypothetical protein
VQFTARRAALHNHLVRNSPATAAAIAPACTANPKRIAAGQCGGSHNLNSHCHQHDFYGAIAAATLIGVLFNLISLDPIKALFCAAVINGVVAVPLMVVIMTRPIRALISWIAAISGQVNSMTQAMS